MGNFLTSFFSNKSIDQDNTKADDKNQEKNFDILKYDGLRAQQIGKFDYAICCYNKALELNEEFETLNYLVSAYIQKGMFDEAHAATKRMILQEPENLQAYIAEMNVCFMQESYPEVVKQANYILSVDAKSHPAQFIQAKALKMSKDLFGALIALTKTIALKDDFLEAYLLRAEVLHDLHQEKEAMEDIEKALSLAPEDENAFLLRGEINESLGDAKQAKLDYSQTLDLNPFNEHALLLLGQLYIKENELEEAILFFTDVIDSNPDFGKAYTERGRAYYLKGDKKAAAEDMKRGIELNPEGEEAKRFEGEIKNFGDMYKGGIF